MAGKFMKVKTLVVPVISLIVLASQIFGTSVVASASMVDMINNGQEITIEVSQPSYSVDVQGTQQQTFEWTQLDQLKTFNAFRQGFDEVFNINTITEGGINGKSGCLFVDKDGDRNGNTTLQDALRNKVFVTKYWSDSNVKNKVIALGKEAYTDVSESDSYALAGAINAYFNLIPSGENPTAFNPTKSMTREDFYSMVFRGTTSVDTITTDQSFVSALGGKTMLSDYAQGVDELGFLSINNKSLDQSSYKGSISRAEAVYMLVNKLMPDQLEKVSGTDKAYRDCKNAGDLALKAGFKDKNSDGTITSKDRWQSYTLAYMMQHPEDGMQEELYKAMVVAKNNNLISESDSRWDEPISQAEAVNMLVSAGLAQNNLYGYTSEAEYGKINANKFTISTEEQVVKGYNADGTAYGDGWAEPSAEEKTSDPNKVLSSGLTLFEAGQQIKALVNNLQSMGESVDSNMDYINKQCDKLGTTYEEISKLPVDVMNQTASNKQDVYQKIQSEAPARPGASAPSTNNGSYNFGATGSNQASTQVTESKPQQSTTNSNSSGKVSIDSVMGDGAASWDSTGGGTTGIDKEFDAMMQNANR